MIIKNEPAQCCNKVTEEPYKHPTIKESAQRRINQVARAITRENKLIEFADKFPEAAKFLQDNEIEFYT